MSYYLRDIYKLLRGNVINFDELNALDASFESANLSVANIVGGNVQTLESSNAFIETLRFGTIQSIDTDESSSSATLGNVTIEGLLEANVISGNGSLIQNIDPVYVDGLTQALDAANTDISTLTATTSALDTNVDVLSSFVASNTQSLSSNVGVLSSFVAANTVSLGRNVATLSSFVTSNTSILGSNVSILSSFVASNTAALGSNIDWLSHFVASNTSITGSNVDTLSSFVASNTESLGSNVDTLSSFVASNTESLGTNVDTLSSFVASNTESLGTNVDTLSSFVASNTSALGTNVDTLSSFVASNTESLGSNVDTLSSFVASNTESLGSNVDTLSSFTRHRTDTFQANIEAIANTLVTGNVVATYDVSANTGTFDTMTVTNLDIKQTPDGSGGGLSGTVGVRTDVFTGGVVDGDLFQYNGAMYGNASGLTGFSTKTVSDLESRLADYANSSRRLYVSTTGSDENTGKSRDQAFRTVKKACSVARTLTVIMIEAGTYTEDNPIYVPPNVALTGDSLRNTLLLPANPRVDYFHLTNMNYLIQLRFVDLRSPGFCCAFPCSIADPYIQNGKVVPKHDPTSTRINVIYSPKAPTGYYNTKLPPIDTQNPVTYVEALFGGIAAYIQDQSATFDPVAVSNPGGMKRAAELLRSNTVFLKNEIMAFVDEMISDGDLTLTQNQKTLCRRDVGYIVDAVATDLEDGENIQSLAAAVRYYDNNGSILTAGTVNPTAKSVVLLGTLAELVVQELFESQVTFDFTDGTGTQTVQYTLAQTSSDMGVYNVTSYEPGLIPTQTFDFAIARVQSLLTLFADIVEDPFASPDPTAVSIATGPGQQRVSDIAQEFKSYLQNAVLAWVDQNITDPTLSTINKTKCARDVGYIVDALTRDLRSGGYMMTKEYADLYYVGTASVLPADQTTPTADAIRYLRDEIVRVIRRFSDPANVFDQSSSTSFESLLTYRNRNGTNDAYVALTLELPGPKLFVGYRLSQSNLKKFRMEARETTSAVWTVIHEADNVEPLVTVEDVEAQEAADIAQALFRGIAAYIEDPTVQFPDRALKNAGGYTAAGSIVSQNVGYFQAEVRTFVDSMIADGELVLSDTNKDKCIRDVGILVAAVSNDLVKGSFMRSLESAEKYFNANGSILPQSTISPTSRSVDVLATLVPYIITSTPVPTSVSKQYAVTQILATPTELNQQTFGTTATVAYSHYRLVMIQTQRAEPFKVGALEFLDMAPPDAICDGPTQTNSIVTGFEIIEPGLGYTMASTLRVTVRPQDPALIEDVDYTASIGTATIETGRISSITLDPQQLIADGGRNSSGPIRSIHLTNSGKGYAETPAVIIDGGGGSGAVAVAWIDAKGRVATVELVESGTGYTSAPTIRFEYTRAAEQITAPITRRTLLVLQSSYVNGRLGPYAFSDVSSTYWQSGTYPSSQTTTVDVDGSSVEYTGEWIQIQFEDLQYIESVTLNPVTSTNAPRTFVIAGSLDGLGWTSLTRESNIFDYTAGSDRAFVLSNPGEYTYLRLIIEQTTGGTDVQLNAIKYFAGLKPPTTPATAECIMSGSTDQPWTMERGNFSGPVRVELTTFNGTLVQDGIDFVDPDVSVPCIITPIMADDYAEIDAPLYKPDTSRNINDQGQLETVRILHSGSGYVAPPDELVPTISIPAPEIIRPIIVGSPYVQNCTNLSGPWDTTGEKVPVTWPLPWNVDNIYNNPGGPGYNSNRPTDSTKTSVRVLDNNGSGGGIRIDGHTPSPLSPLRSYVCDAFTQVNQGGIGFLLINLAYAQFVSTFGTFCNVHAACISGATANFSNSVTDFGRTGLLARGYFRDSYLRGVVQALPDDWDDDEYVSYGYNPSIPGYVSKVEAIRVEVGGAGYADSPVPKVTIAKPSVAGQTTATADAQIDTGAVAAITITNKGDGYKAVPTVTIDPPVQIPIGEGGEQATAEALVSRVSRCRVFITGGIPRRYANNRKPDALSLVRIHGVFYTVTAVSEVYDGSTLVPDVYDLSFGGIEGAPIYVDIDHDVEFFYVSQLSTGSHVFEFCGDKERGCTYNSLPEYGGDAGTQKKDAEIDSLAPAKIYFTSSDHLGNQRIGDFFAVNQSTGSIAVDAQSFDLSKIQNIGPFLRNGIPQGVALAEVSTNINLIASTGQQATDTVPTQSAVAEYVGRRAVPLTGGQVGYVLRIPEFGVDGNTVTDWEWGEVNLASAGVVSVVMRADVINGLVADGNSQFYGDISCYGNVDTDAIILTSTNGTRYTLTISDGGSLQIDPTDT